MTHEIFNDDGFYSLIVDFMTDACYRLNFWMYRPEMTLQEVADDICCEVFELACQVSQNDIKWEDLSKKDKDFLFSELISASERVRNERLIAPAIF